MDVHTSEQDGLIVRNTGPGIAAESIEELFQPFRRGCTDRTGSDTGAGLGLSIVASTAAAHGAGIVARTSDGGGMDIRIRVSKTE